MKNTIKKTLFLVTMLTMIFFVTKTTTVKALETTPATNQFKVSMAATGSCVIDYSNIQNATYKTVEYVAIAYYHSGMSEAASAGPFALSQNTDRKYYISPCPTDKVITIIVGVLYTDETEEYFATTFDPSKTTQPVTTVSTPSISLLAMEGTSVGVSASTVSADGFEFRILKKNGSVYKTYSTSSSSHIFYSVKANQCYAAQIRAYKYDASGKKVYSNWSAKKYVMSQPKISTKKSKFAKNGKQISLKWNKISGASKYYVYAKKTTSKKWVKVATTKKTSYKFKKIKKKKINTHKYNYNIRVVAVGKAGGKTIKSDNGYYVRTYLIFR